MVYLAWNKTHDLCYLSHHFENPSKSLMDAVLAKKDQWKCGICSNLFASRATLCQHILTNHKGLKICKRCPYTVEASHKMKLHEQAHCKNDVNYKDTAEGRECKVCHVWLKSNGHLVNHLYKYHLPKTSR